jgi:transcriptional regulator GlxA family with amidase domain
MRIAVYVYDGMTALDAVGPYDILNRIPGAEVTAVGHGRGRKRAEGGLEVAAAADLDEFTTADVVVVPGGGAQGLAEQLRNDRLLDWLQMRSGDVAWVASVCTGALVLGAAGLLHGRRATTHWRARDHLSRYGAVYVDERVVEDGNVMTCGGVTAGIDLALTLTLRLAGSEIARAVQLSAHYAPEPLFPPEHPDRAPSELLTIINEQLGPRSVDVG